MNGKRISALRAAFVIAMDVQGLKQTQNHWRRFKRGYMQNQIAANGAPIFPKNFRNILKLQTAGLYSPASYASLENVSLTKLKRLLNQRLTRKEERVVNITEKEVSHAS